MSDATTAHDLSSGDPEARRAYITQIIAVAADDARNVATMATVALAIVVFFVKDSVQEIQELGWVFRGAAVIAATTLFVGSMFLFQYAALINYWRMGMAHCIASDDAAKAHEIWAGRSHGIRRQKGWVLITGMLMIGSGMFMSAVVASALLLD